MLIMERTEEWWDYVAWYRYWKFTIVPMLIDYEPETREYRVYVWNPSLCFPESDCEAPEDFKYLDDAKRRVSKFISENF